MSRIQSCTAIPASRGEPALHSPILEVWDKRVPGIYGSSLPIASKHISTMWRLAVAISGTEPEDPVDEICGSNRPYVAALARCPWAFASSADAQAQLHLPSNERGSRPELRTAKLIAAAVIAAIRLNREEIRNSAVVHTIGITHDDFTLICPSYVTASARWCPA